MTTVRLVGVPILGLVLGGCATMISGSSQLVTVNSNVEGAEVHLVADDGTETLLGTTPLTARLERRLEGSLRVSAEGYQTYQRALNRTINPTFFVNVPLSLSSSGTFGSTTDYSTGAMYAYEPSTFMASLQPEGLSPAERDQWRLREELRGFVLQNSQAIVSDLAARDGEYIDVLVHVLEVSSADRLQAIERWQVSYAESKTALEFAQKMVADLD